MATSSAAVDSAAARASQRSCSRSVPRARRYRPTSDPAPTTTPTRTTRALGRNRALSAGTPNGLPTDGCSGYSGVGLVTPARAPVAAAAATSRAHQRQRGDGNVPVGVSSRTKPTIAGWARTPAACTPTSQAAPGTAPGRATSP